MLAVAAKSALIVVDVQNDFCEGGALAAKDTLSLLEPLRKFVEEARARGMVIVFTQDWHPAEHQSFVENGGPWPVHCVAGSAGAALAAAFGTADLKIHKGIARDDDGYSAFPHTDLAASLRELGVADVAVCGIATEYCVRATAVDGVAEGFGVSVLTDLIRAVRTDDGVAACDAMGNAGVAIVASSDWLSIR